MIDIQFQANFKYKDVRFYVHVVHQEQSVMLSRAEVRRFIKKKCTVVNFDI